MTRFAIRSLLAGVAVTVTLTTPVLAQAPPGAPAAGGAPAGAPPAPRRKRQPPPAIMPIAETAAATKSYSAGNYEQAVSQAKTALTKNDKYTPAMLVMAKAYYKLRKYEWVRHLDKMMQANNASEGERAEMYHLLAWMEIEKKNVPGSIDMLKKSTDLRAENPVTWNNLGAQYLEAKNYKDAAPALEKAVQLNPTFAKAYLNLGSAYRGLKDYDRAQGSYQKALQLFPNYADAVFHLGLLYLDAEKMANMDTIARLNTSVGHFQRYKQMMGSLLRPADPVDGYIAEAQDKIGKEQRRIERQKKQEERDKQRQTQKGAPSAQGEAGKPAGPPADADKAAQPAAKKSGDTPPPPAN
jgi:tetratricopeptide (TPR) repeat protein